MTTPSRIEDLRRRVDRDPASVAFAQLAEEHRRNSHYDEAVRVARGGLVHVPGYLSARVTLGRALLELGQVDDARRELESVLATAPDNLAAVRTLAELRQRSAAAGATAPPASPAPIAAVAPDVFLRAGTASPDAQAAAALERWLAAIVADRATRG